MYTYRVYGTVVDAEIELPELSPQSDVPSEASIELANFNTTTDQHFVPGYGHVRVRDGERLLVDPCPNASAEAIRQLIYGPGLRLLFHDRGAVTLHGSTVVIGDTAIVFLGDSGAGKSTTAAAFEAAGHEVLADDLAIIPDPNSPLVYPGPASVRLDERTAVQIGLSKNDSGRSIGTKRRFQLTEPDDPHRGYPLERLYLLEYSEEISISEIPSGEQLYQLMYHSYNEYDSHETEKDSVSPHFDRCSELIQDVDLFRLGRPDDLQTITNVVDAVRDDLVDAIDG